MTFPVGVAGMAVGSGGLLATPPRALDDRPRNPRIKEMLTEIVDED